VTQRSRPHPNKSRDLNKTILQPRLLQNEQSGSRKSGTIHYCAPSVRRLLRHSRVLRNLQGTRKIHSLEGVGFEVFGVVYEYFYLLAYNAL
jgi:hypothetical protein